MNKRSTKSGKVIKPRSKVSVAAWVSIIVAIIGCLGTFIAAIVGYFGLRYQVDQSVRPTETFQENAKLDLRARLMSNSWNVALVLPDNVSPENNSYSTLIEYSDFNDWLVAPKTLSSSDDVNISTGRLLQAEIDLGNSSVNNGSWMKIDNKVKITLDLVSSNIQDHVNLVWVKSGGGGADYKYFSLIKLGQDISLINQTITSKDYDFFTLQPGESDVFILEFLCEAPGIYQASARLSVTSPNGLQEEKVTGFGKIMCPNSYTLWFTPLAVSSSEPLEYLGDFSWDGTSYIEKP